MTYPYCSGQDACEFVGDLTEDSSNDVSSDNNAVLVSQDAGKIFAVIKHRTGTDDPTLYTPDAFVAKLLALINATRSGLQLIDRRGTDTDPKFFGIATIHKRFAERFYKLLENKAFLSAWKGTYFYSTPLPSIRPSSRSWLFMGSGSGELSSSGDYRGKETAIFTAKILTSTTFQWKKDVGDTLGAYSAPVTITGSAQLLSDGVTITLPTSGHIANDMWVIAIKVHVTVSLVVGQCPGLDHSDDKARPLAVTLDKWIDWMICPVYAIAVSYGYPINNLTPIQAQTYGDIIGKFVAAFALIAMALGNGKGLIDMAAMKKIKDAEDLFEEFRNRKLSQILKRN